MIVRIWRGKTQDITSDEYFGYLKKQESKIPHPQRETGECMC
jgi:hypothetical protein